MKHRWLSVVLILALVVAVSAWWFQEQLAFTPEVGSKRTFVIETRMELQRAGERYNRRQDVLKTSIVTHSEVVSSEGGALNVSNRAQQIRIHSNGDLIDSRQPDSVSERYDDFFGLLRAGSELRVSHQGQLLDWALADQVTAEALQERFPPVFLQRVAALATLTQFQPMFPEQSLAPGLTWEAPAAKVGGLMLPQRRYEVTALDEQRVTVRMYEVDEAGDASALGYLMLERSTGWPLTARLRVAQTSEIQGREYNEVVYISIRQPTERRTLSRSELEQMAYRYREYIPFDPDWPESLEYLKPAPVLTEDEIAEGRERLNQSLLWFPPEQGLVGAGLDVAFTDLVESGLILTDLHRVDALDDQGLSIDPELTLDHGFDLSNVFWNQEAFRPVKHPFDPRALAPETLARIHQLALEADVLLPGQAVELSLRPADSGGKVVAAQGYEVRDIQWADEQVRFQVQRTDGRPVGRDIRLTAIPESGESLPNAFESRITLAALAPVADQLTEGSHHEFVSSARAELYPVPDEEIWQAYQVDLSVPQPVERVSVYIQPYQTRVLNFRVANAAGTLSGGPVIGTRLLDDFRMPEFNFPAIDMEAFALSGARHNQLEVELPPQGGNRCSATVVSPAEYQGSPWSLNMGWGSFHSSLQLMTENRQRFFYDAQVTLELQCVTDIEMQVEPVDESEQVRRIDAHTVELSETLFEELVAIDEYQSTHVGNRLPVVGRNRAGEALEMLSGLHEYQGQDAGAQGNPRRIKFWGEVAEITYPKVTGVEAKNVTVEFPPLP